jgi:hypothetical protein
MRQEMVLVRRCGMFSREFPRIEPRSRHKGLLAKIV